MGIPNANFSRVPLVHIRKLSTHCLHTLWENHVLITEFYFKVCKIYLFDKCTVLLSKLEWWNYQKYGKTSQGCLGIYEEHLRYAHGYKVKHSS